MIADLLDGYYDQDVTFNAISSDVINGHEVAWMEYRGHIYSLDGEKRERREYSGRALYCECDFKEGVGWERKDGHIYSLDGEKRCLARQAIVYMRQLALRQQYAKQFNDDGWGDDFHLKRHVSDIILDLITRAQAGEFIGEDSNGAAFWGGYFYLQTVAAITNNFVGHLWDDLAKMAQDKLISVEGAVIGPYRKPPPPTWTEELRYEDDDGWVGVAYLPGNRTMAKAWKLEVLDPDGTAVYGGILGEGLNHDPIFGPDVEDVAHAKTRLIELITSAKKRYKQEKALSELTQMWQDDPEYANEGWPEQGEKPES